MSRTINKILDLYGELVTIKRRATTIDSTTGRPSYSFPYDSQYETWAIFYETLGESLELDPVGPLNIDQGVVLFKSDIKSSISPFDIIENSSGEQFEMERIISRKRGYKIDFIEVLVRRIEEA